MAVATIYLKEDHVKRGRGAVLMVCVVGAGGFGGLKAAFP